MKASIVLLFLTIMSQDLFAQKTKVTYEFTARNSTGLIFGRSDIAVPGLMSTLQNNGFQGFASGTDSYDLRLEQFGFELSFAPHWVPLNFSIDYLQSSLAQSEPATAAPSATLSRSAYNFNMAFALSRGLLNLDLRGGIGSHLMELTLKRDSVDDNPLFNSSENYMSYVAFPTVYSYGVEAYMIAYFRFKIGVRMIKEKSSDLVLFESYEQDLPVLKSSLEAVQNTAFVGIAF